MGMWEADEKERREADEKDKKRIGKFIRSRTDDFLLFKVVLPLRDFLHDMAGLPMTSKQHGERKNLYDMVDGLYDGKDKKTMTKTESERALEALTKYEATGEFIPAMERLTIRHALQQSGKVEGLVEVLEWYASIGDQEQRRRAKEALAAFEKQGE